MNLDMTRAARQPVSAAEYNALPKLGDASKFLQEQGLIDTMKRVAEPIFLRHGMQEFWAIYILHTHWPLRGNEIAAEDKQDERHYLMRPVPAGDVDRYAPSLFSLAGGRLQALEFSSTPLAHTSYKKLCANPVFVHELAEAFARAGIDRHFGLGALRLPEHDDCGWVEYTQAGGGRGSMMTSTRIGSISDTDVVRTSWHFMIPRRPMNCWKHFSCCEHVDE